MVLPRPAKIQSTIVNCFREKPIAAKAGKWQPKDWDTIWREFEAQCSAEEVALARDLLEWFKPQFDEVVPTRDGFAPIFRSSDVKHNPLKIETAGKVRIWLSYLKNKPPFQDVRLRREFCDRLGKIPGVSISDEQLGGMPGIPLALLRTDEALAAFKDAVTWMLEVLWRGS